MAEPGHRAGTAAAGLEVRPAAQRATTVSDGVTSRHGFSFGAHYDPGNVRFGLLLAVNEELLVPGGGFATHPHRDLEIVTWPVRGDLVHADSTGGRGVLRPGRVGRLTAGSGVLHSETSPGGDPAAGRGAGDSGPTQLLQMWLQPDEPGLPPGHVIGDVDPDALRGRLVPVVSGMARHRGDTAVLVAQRDATMHVARLAAGEWVTLPVAPFVHVQVSVGAVTVEGAGALAAGDAVRVLGSDGRRVTGAATPGPVPQLSEVLVWEMARSIGGS